MNAPASTMQSIINSLSGIVEKQNILTDPETLQKYSCDISLLPPHMPDVVVKVKKTSEVQGVLKVAHENHIPVVPRSS